MGYHLREGFRSIFTHGLMSFAAVCMILACLIIMGSFSLVAINIDNTLLSIRHANHTHNEMPATKLTQAFHKDLVTRETIIFSDRVLQSDHDNG